MLLESCQSSRLNEKMVEGREEMLEKSVSEWIALACSGHPVILGNTQAEERDNGCVIINYIVHMTKVLKQVLYNERPSKCQLVCMF